MHQLPNLLYHNTFSNKEKVDCLKDSNNEVCVVPNFTGYTQKEIGNLEHSKIPDPIADAMKYILSEQRKLEERINKLKKK